jgi:NAD(P)-dependent dehydrogenase (short-subunit alcohol dehydrogenase family)
MLVLTTQPSLSCLLSLLLVQVKPEEDILVNALLPGFVRTEMSKMVVPEDLPQQVQPLLFRLLSLQSLITSVTFLSSTHTQLGTRWRTPEEVGQDVVHLVTQSSTDGPRAKLLLEGKEQPW